MFIHSSILLITWAWDYSKSQLWSLIDGKLDHPHDGEYLRDEDDDDDDDDGLGNGEDGEDHREDDGNGIRWPGGGDQEELQNE